LRVEVMEELEKPWLVVADDLFVSSFFTQVILFLSEAGILEELEKQWLVLADDLACAGAVEEDVRVLGVVHVQVC
jgi:hypothetical protein